MYPCNSLICKIITWRRCSLKLIFVAVVAEGLKEHLWPSIYLENCSPNPNGGSIALLCHWGTFLVVQPPDPIFWPSWTFFKLFHVTFYIYFLLKITRIGSVFFFFLQPTSFPGGACSKEPACQCRRSKRCRFDLWVGKIPLEEGMTTLSSILAWTIPWTEESGDTVHRVAESWI